MSGESGMEPEAATDRGSEGPRETVEGAWRVPFSMESEGNGGC